MRDDKSHTVTNLLSGFRRDEPGADARLIERVYRDLHKLAARSLSMERQGHSLPPTALVTDIYLRLLQQRQKLWKNRAHFFAVAKQLAREILIDFARGHRARKRGGGQPHVSLDDPAVDVTPSLRTERDRFEQLLALDEALIALAAIAPRQARIFKLHVFGGMACREIAKRLDVSERTVNRELQAAKRWLYRRLRPLPHVSLIFTAPTSCP